MISTIIQIVCYIIILGSAAGVLWYALTAPPEDDDDKGIW